MSEKQPAMPPAGFSLGDIYFVVFRHKWKILFCSMAGIAAAVFVYMTTSLPYQSQAELFVKYVVDYKPPNVAGNASLDETTDGNKIVGSEVGILTSLDVANEVAGLIGPAKILAKIGGGTDQSAAAAAIRKGLGVEVPRGTSILRITFQHPDPEIVQPVLTQIIASYKRKHDEIHRGGGAYDDFLAKKRDELSAQLAQSELNLKNLKTKAGILSLDETKKTYSDQISRIRNDLLSAETELAESQAVIGEMVKALPGKVDETATNLGVPAEKVTEYKSIAFRLDYWRQRAQDLTTKGGFTDEAKMVKNAEAQITTNEFALKQLEEEYPRLATLNISTASSGQRNGSGGVSSSLANEATKVVALQARTNILNMQLAEIEAAAGELSEAESPIVAAQRQKEIVDSQYRYISGSLEQARFDDAVRAGRISNIEDLGAPTPPTKPRAKLNKKLGMLIFGGIAAGVGLAFLSEMYMDRTFKRAVEIETRLRWPLMLVIPDKSREGWLRLPGIHRRKLIDNGQLLLEAPKNGNANNPDEAIEKVNGHLPPWDDQHVLRPFYEALRDRLMTDFENRGLTHKPKLVAVTGCNPGAGVTSTAAGLAAKLSETGEGNVLLVDMNLRDGAAHPFYRGKPVCGLNELLELQKDPQREAAMVKENLYMAAAGRNGDTLQRMLPKRFANLVPKLKASDYDYIIFDMPLITQTSVTPRLAGLMDTVLLVIEAEKTDQEIAKRASTLLEESKAHVNVVLNKTRSYVPPRLHQEFLHDA